MIKHNKNIFNLNKILRFIFSTLGIILIIYVFYKHLEDTVLAYCAYLLSTYSLIEFCIWFYKACKFSNNYIKENSKLYKLYNNNLEVIAKWSLVISFSFNLIYGLFKLVLGIIYKSEWFITFAVYYLLLFFIKSSLALSAYKKSFGENLRKEYIKLKNTGIVLFLLNIILIGIIVLIIQHNQIVSYPEYLIYVVAMYDFYLIISASINVFKYRKSHSPILGASKCINLTVAMISMISLTVAMIYHFGDNNSEFKPIMISCMGFVVCFVNSLMSIHMITKSIKYLKQPLEKSK